MVEVVIFLVLLVFAGFILFFNGIQPLIREYRRQARTQKNGRAVRVATVKHKRFYHFTPSHPIRGTLQIAVFVFALIFSAYLIIKPDADEETKKFAYGIFGVALGYWLRQFP